MKTIVKIEGLDCPNCARALENQINKLKNVENAKINFLKSTLTFESENCEKALKDVVALTKKVEPNAKIVVDDKKTSKENQKTEEKQEICASCCNLEMNASGKKTSSDKNAKQKKKLILDVTTLLLGIAIGIVIFFVNIPTWAYWTLYAISALLLGYKTYYKAITLLFRGVVNENLLITISVIGASVVSEHMEGLMVIALYSIGKIFEGLAVDKSRKSIEKLARMQPDYAVIINEKGEEEKVSPKDVKLGSTIVVKPGEKVALDGKILEGSCAIDMQSLTGESVPVHVKKGDEILSGSIVLDGVLKIQTTSEFAESTITKIMNLVENASENKSKTETFISKITRWYTLGIVVLALLVWAIVWAVTKDFDTALYRGLIFLVISCPCAFAISVPLTYFSGLGNASKHGVLIKGSNFLDACSRLNVVAFDKTGTLTTGKFEIEEIHTFDKSLTENDILFLCAVGEQNSLHPLAKAITSACKTPLKKATNVTEIAGSGVEFTLGKKRYFVGRKTKDLSSTTVELFENDKKVGEILLSDSVKNTSQETCAELEKMGIKTVLLSGDNEQIVVKVAESVGINEAHSKLLPQDKYAWISSNKSKQNRIGYVGDGINDAPSLTLADVGFSMGINGSPASIEASDVVLVDDDPKKIISAIQISKYTRKIVLENIILSAVVKIVFLALGSFGVTGMLAAVFADVGVTLLAILNSLRALKFKPKTKQDKHKK